MKSSDLRKKSKKIKEMDENKKSHDKKTLLRR